MATRANRAATAANKKGGKKGRRNPSVDEIDSHRPLDAEENQQAFRDGRHDTLARAHNAATGIATEPGAPGVPEGLERTPPHPGARSEEHEGERRFKEHSPHQFKLMSLGLQHRSELAARYTTEGERFSPPLAWSGAPARSEEFVLICEDLNSETGEPRVHWLVYRIAAAVRELPEGVPEGDRIDAVLGTPLQGRNSAGFLGYLPPALTPFDGWHHYRFRLFALEAPLRNVRPGMSKAELLEAMEPHVLEETELVCRYRRADFRGAA